MIFINAKKSFKPHYSTPETLCLCCVQLPLKSRTCAAVASTCTNSSAGPCANASTTDLQGLTLGRKSAAYRRPPKGPTKGPIGPHEGPHEGP